MKYILSILFLSASFFLNAQNKTIKQFGGGGYNINGYSVWYVNGTDTIFKIMANGVDFRLPFKPASYTTSGAPSAASYNGYIIYNSDSSAPQYSDGSSWKNFGGSSGGGGGLPVKPAGYGLWSTGSGWDTSDLIYLDRINKKVGFGTSAPTHAITLDSASAFSNGIALYSTGDQTTNYARFRMETKSSGVTRFVSEKGGTATAGGFVFVINGTSVADFTAGQFLITGQLGAYTDNSVDIGRLSASPLRFRSGYFGTSLQAGAAANTAIAARFHAGPATTTLAQIYLEDGVAPTSPTNGMIWRKGDSLYYRIGGVSELLYPQSGAGGGNVSFSDTASVIATKSDFGSGTYTPTIANTTNISSCTPAGFKWIRIGNMVHVSGYLNIEATSSSSSTGFTITLPISSDLTNAQDLTGTLSGGYTASNTFNGMVRGEGSLNIAAVNYTCTATSEKATITFMYEIK